MRTHTLLLGACLVAASAAQVFAQEEHPILQDVRRIQQDVAKMRGLQFQAPVKADVQKPEDLKAMILKSFDEEASKEEMDEQARVIKAFGLIPEDYQLREALIKFMSEQIGGFYDPEKKELFLIDRSDTMGGGMEQKMNDQMVMAHELHHALQDQNFALDRWFDVLGEHEDRIQAYKGLIEGEAQLVGMGYLFEKMGRGKVDMRQLNRMQEMMLKMSPEGAKFRSVPPYLIENMMFPYTQGAEFVQDLQRKFGWEGINKFFHNPPSSTEQILHPEKYFGERDEPQEIGLPKGRLKKLVGKKPKELYENTLGEFSMSLLLRALDVPKAAANKAVNGWDGDRFLGLETGEGRLVVIWLSTWDSENDARRFELVYREALKKKRPDSHLVRRGSEVLWVYGSKGEELTRIVNTAFQALKMEVSYRPTPGLVAKPPASDFDPNKVRPTEEPRVEPAPAASSGTTLVRVEALGLTFALPEGYKGDQEPITEFKEMTAAYYQKGESEAIRVMAMPFTLDDSVRQATREMQGRGWAVSDNEVPRGRSVHAIDDKNGDRTLIHFVEAGENTTVALVLSARKGQLQSMRDQLVGLAPWVDVKPSGQVHRLIHAGHQLSVAQVLKGTVPGDTSKGVIHGQFTKRSRAIVTVRPARGASLDVFGRRLSKQLESQGAKIVAGGIVNRGERAGYEIEFLRKGRRYRQLTVLEGGHLWTVSCSAQEKEFDGLRAEFSALITGFAVKKAAKREVY